MCCHRAHLKDIVSTQDRADSILPHSRSSFSLLSHNTEPCDRIWHTTESTSRLLRTSPTKVRVLAEHSKQVSMSLHLLIVGTTVCMRPNSIMAMLSRQVSHHNLAECHPAPLYTPCSALHCMSTWSTTGVALACRQGQRSRSLVMGASVMASAYPGYQAAGPDSHLLQGLSRLPEVALAAHQQALRGP